MWVLCCAREVLPRFLLCRRRCLSPCTLSTGMPSLPWGRNPKIRTLWSFCEASRSSVMKNTAVVNKNICRDFFVPRNLDTWRSKSKTSSPPTQTLLTIAICRVGRGVLRKPFHFPWIVYPPFYSVWDVLVRREGRKILQPSQLSLSSEHLKGGHWSVTRTIRRTSRCTKQNQQVCLLAQPTYV